MRERVLIDGRSVAESDATLSIFDWAVIRGCGVFEVVRAYDGVPFRLASHLDRLERSASALFMPLPDRSELEAWIRKCAAAGGECQVRVVVTAGGRDAAVAAPSTTIVMWEPLPTVPARLSLLPMKAPWHPATDAGGYAGVKWTSYAPNMASTDQARRMGFDDALLMSMDGSVLEGPTYTIAWVRDGRIETPSLELGILHSITRDVLMESASRVGFTVVESCYPLERLLGADEVLALSTTKQVTPVQRVGESSIPVGEIGRSLAHEFAAIVSAEAVRSPDTAF